MSLSHFLDSARVGITVGLIVLAIGLVAEIGWLALGLPGVHRTFVAPTTQVVSTPYFTDTIVRESYADVSFVPTLVASGIGLAGGFWWAFRRRPATGDTP